MYCYYKCSVALPYDAMGWLCLIVEFSDHTHLLFFDDCGFTSPSVALGVREPL